MDSIDASLQQLQELFQFIVGTLRREQEALHAACQQFELVCPTAQTLSNVHHVWILHTFRTRMHARAHTRTQERQVVVDTCAKQTDVVKMDVGGTHFHVSRSVLTSQSNCLLDSLFSGRFRVDTQEDGTVFIDRSGCQ